MVLRLLTLFKDALALIELVLLHLVVVLVAQVLVVRLLPLVQIILSLYLVYIDIGQLARLVLGNL